MSVHQCPKCELRFTYQTELDYHCREEHPDFKHDYPVHHAEPPTSPTGPQRRPPGR